MTEPLAFPKYLDRALQADIEAQADAQFKDLMFVQSVLAQCILPVKKVDGLTYERKIGRASLRLSTGQSFERNSGTYRDGLGLPYGPKARLILLHICAEAIRTQSPEIEINDSMSAFMRNLGLKVTGGKTGTIRGFKEQVQRLATTRISLNWQAAPEDVTGDEILEAVDDRALFSGYSLWTPNGEKAGFQGSTVRLSGEFYNQLLTHGVPLHAPAIRALTDSARALDIYCWLAYRLCRVTQNGGQLISWQAIQAQFGDADANPKTFRRHFKQALARAVGVYPEAFGCVEIIDNGKRSGICLRQAPPPVPYKLSAAKRLA